MIEPILSRLEKVRQRGQGRWTACCPAHPDRSPSLSITETDDKVMLHCFAGCQAEDIVAAIGLTMSDLFREPMSNEKRQQKKAYYSAEQRLDDETLLMVADANRENGRKLTPEELEMEKQAWVRLNANT